MADEGATRDSSIFSEYGPDVKLDPLLVDNAIGFLPPESRGLAQGIKTKLEEQPLLAQVALWICVLLLLGVVVWVFYVIFTLIHAVNLLDEGECAKPGVHFLFGNIFWYTLAAIGQGFLIGAIRGALAWFVEIPHSINIIIVSVHLVLIFLMLLWGMFMWFTTTDECADLYGEKYFHLWAMFKVYVLWQIVALGALGYELSTVIVKSSFQEVEEKGDDWTKKA